MTADQRRALREAAQAVPESAQGAWTAASEGDDPDSAQWYVDAMSGPRGGVQVCTMSNGGDEETALFIAVANPAALLALLDDLYQNDRTIETLQAATRLYVTTGDAMVARIGQLEALLREAQSHLKYHREETGDLRFNDPLLIDRIDAALAPTGTGGEVAP